jgi:hypothetical protein
MDDSIQKILDTYRSQQPKRATGGLYALSGFRFQLLSYLADFVTQVISQGVPEDKGGLVEFLSDYSSSRAGNLLLVQCKTRLTKQALMKAAVEFVHIERFRTQTFAADQFPPPTFGVVFRTSDIDPIPAWDSFQFTGNDERVLQNVWTDLVATNRVAPPTCHADPELELVSKLRSVTNEPHAILAELLEIALSRGDGVPADNIRKQLCKCIEKATVQSAIGNCRYLYAEDFRPLPDSKDLRVGRSPTISQLRRGELFRRKSLVDTLVRELESVRTEPEVLTLFWISGRSGSGKSAILLQVMEELCNSGELVAWLPEGAIAMTECIRNWPTSCGDSATPRFLFVDDLYSPNVRDRIGLDVVQSMLMYEVDRNWPIIVSCGPPEFLRALRRDFGTKPLNCLEWKLPLVTLNEREKFVNWFEARSGKQARRGRAAAQEEGLIISLAHELEQGDLLEFANRFADRLRASNLAVPMCVSLAVNRL